MALTEKIRTGLAVIRTYARNIRGHKHEPEVAFLPLMLQKDDICLHIGATDGRHSYIMAKSLTGKGHIYAYEPSPITFPVLQHMMALHGLKDKVTITRKAVSDKAQMLTLNVPIKRNGHRGNALGFTSKSGEKSAGRADVPSQSILRFDVEATTIDDIVATEAKRMDFLRMDVEGSENLALKGGWKSIEKFRPHCLIEIHPVMLESQFGTKPQEIYDAFKALGYTIHHLEEGKLVPSPNLDIRPWKDYFFLHPSRPHNLPLL